MLKPNGREVIEDKEINTGEKEVVKADSAGEQFRNKLFLRLVAKKAQFKRVDFSYTIFDSVYFKNCTFDSCNFIGCKFLNSNLSGSSFHGCDFIYSTFDKTQVDTDILKSEFNGRENLKLKFARSLRLNYQQLGDSKAVNKAMGVELQATETHLKKSWHSDEKYYRDKYKGIRRFQALLEWVNFKFLDLVWGNGESATKLVRCMVFLLIVMAMAHVFFFGDTNSISDYLQSAVISVQVFLGVIKPLEYSNTYLAFIYSIKLVMFGFFVSIVVKRFNRR
ncbi:MULTISPECIES: pentapeptide repeat-containing protein [Cobetia]|uniref:pentapeptide repeat-containing protein n=1 Tax=Cobetia TaxID=204286 RepID=UPI001581FA6E|nr:MULTISPECIES: pentapeptide repeat-containing protein [Cobetia]MDI4659745.1 pentapeptide repeat-containing protein [Cobetia sp. BMC6]NUJ55152.1 pentapeptide repeat-containing protein [Cobetia marina]